MKFDSPQWPLTLAFAFAGLADLLPPIRLAEEWLRNRAFRAAGIPVRVEQTTRSLIANLEDRSKQNGNTVSKDAKVASTSGLARMLKHYRDNWEEQFKLSDLAKESFGSRFARYDELLSLLSEIELLVVWAKTERGGWPGVEVSSRVREAEAKYIDQGDKLLNDLLRRLQEKLDVNKITHLAKARFDEYLSVVAKDAIAIRFELVTLLAIFLERDPDSPATVKPIDPKHPRPIDALADLLKTTDRPDAVGRGPEAGLLVLLIPTFVLITAGAWQGAQELVGLYVETSNARGVLLTSLVETLKIASLTFLPLLAAFSFRQYLWDTKDWAGIAPAKNRQRAARLNQMMACLGLGLTASLVGLTGVALLRAFSIAQNADYFNALLFNGPVPFMLYYPTLAATVIPLVPLCLAAADARADNRSGLVYAIVGACSVLLLLIAHGTFWDPSWVRGCLAIFEFVTAQCSRRLDTLSRLILIGLVFVSISVLGAPGPNRPRIRGDSIKVLLAFAGITLAAIGLVGPALAQDKIRVGFRNDVEPFSYQVTDEAGQSRYVGYLADLCHEIFDGPEYDVEEVAVTAANRFKLINGEAVEEKQPIQVLCDAVTMRFSGSGYDDAENDRSENSIYSPIVFASGVSYLMRSSRGPTDAIGDMAIGYVASTTAADVAFKSCYVDLLKAIAPPERQMMFERCHFLASAAAARQRIQQFLLSSPTQELALGPKQKKEREGALKKERDGALKAIREARQYAQDLSRIVFTQQNGDLAPVPSSRRFALAFLKVLTANCRDPSLACDNASNEELRSIAGAATDPVCPEQNKPATDQDATSWREYHFCPMESHQDLIQWFCQDDKKLRRVYMGDRELILGKLESWEAKNSPCVVEEANGFDYLTYEPYALLVTANDTKLVQFVQKRVYQIFSHRHPATNLFSSYFRDRKMSPALAYLFLLNAVDLEENYLIPSDSRPADGDKMKKTAPPLIGILPSPQEGSKDRAVSLSAHD
ncbi:hypothetical protein [Rhizobium pisi]|uniref:hypothetical protein n=1 Tax=Rhizobium pisi TaxID=574561 RepID=UPI003CFE96A9